MKLAASDLRAHDRFSTQLSIYSDLSITEAQGTGQKCILLLHVTLLIGQCLYHPRPYVILRPMPLVMMPKTLRSVGTVAQPACMLDLAAGPTLAQLLPGCALVHTAQQDCKLQARKSLLLGSFRC